LNPARTKTGGNKSKESIQKAGTEMADQQETDLKHVFSSSKYKLRFMLDYGCNCLWSEDKITENRFGYHIKNLNDVGLTETTIQLNEYVSDLYYLRLNPIYQSLPSFWSGEMHLFFQNKLMELYNKVVEELSDKFEIVIPDITKNEMNEKIDVVKINSDLKKFVEDPVAYFTNKGISFYGEQSLIDEVNTEYENWKKEEQKYILR
jgi:hypothetical protein